MTNASDIAVIIPLFNGEAWIGATLQSVLEQEVAPTDIVVVDDGSTDGGREVVATYPEVRLLQNPDKGPNPARCFALTQTTAPLVCFLDQDDVWHPAHLRLLAGALAEDPSAPAAVSDCAFFRDGAQPRFADPVLDVVPFDPWDRYPATFPNAPSAALIRRSALERVGGWPTDVTGVADFYTWLRLSECGLLLHNRYASVGRRLHAGSHGASLRAQQAVFFARNLTDAAERAAQHWTEAHPEDAEAMARKQDVVRAVAGIVESLQTHDASALAEATLLLERSLADEPEEQIQPALGVLLWFLNLRAETPEDRMATLRFLLASWHRSAHRTNTLLQARLLKLSSRSELARCVALRPAVPALWRMFFRSVAQGRRPTRS